MRFYIHKAAEAELDDAVQNYEECQPGLGIDFAEEVYSAIVRISHSPDAWSVLSGNTGRCITNRFPFGIVYQTRSNMIHDIAVANLRSAPAYWKDRL